MVAMPIKTLRVVIIGAGPAGIAAATRLLEAGFQNVLMLEAESRIGGRVHTVPFADNVVDLGAQWCHGQINNVIYETVREHDMLESTGPVYDNYKCIRSNGELVPEEVSEQLKSIIFNSIPERRNELVGYEGSLGAYLTDKFWREIKKLPLSNDRKVAKEFFEFAKKDESFVECADHLFEVSGAGHLEYWPCDGDLMLNWKDKGFISLLRLLMKVNSDENAGDFGLLNKRVLLEHRVEEIIWKDEEQHSLIKCSNDQTIIADHIICTVSLGVLKDCHQSMFQPPLPETKCRAIKALKLGTVNKFYMEFDRVFGPTDWTSFCFLWLEEDLIELRSSEYFWLESVLGLYRVSYQPRLLEGWIIGSHARYMETLSEQTVLEGLLWLLKKFLTFHVSEPINFVRTKWYSNPSFRGSYSFRSLYTAEMRTGASDLAAPLCDDSGKPRLQFAGEATSTHYYATVHGAIESGWREAKRLIDYYQIE